MSYAPQRMRKPWRVVSAGIAVAALSSPLALGVSCGGADIEKVCVPGRTETCACDGGGQGLHSCKADGSGFGGCGSCPVVAKPAPPAELRDVTAELGLPENAGPCVGFDDFDGDGDLDLVTSRLLEKQVGLSIVQAELLVYANLGDGTFSKAPVGKLLEGGAMVCTTADYDRDGRPDIVVETGKPAEGETRRLFFFRNDGNFTFTDVADGFDVATVEDNLVITVATFDYDTDGWLDIMIGRALGGGANSSDNCSMTDNDFVCTAPPFMGAQEPLVYRNVNGKFTRLKSAFKGPYPGTTNALAFADLDGNGLPDVFMANDWYTNHLHLQVKPGVYERAESVLGLNLFNHGMGVGINDFDLDGHPDVYVADLGPNSFYFGKADGSFENVNQELGISSVTRYHSNWAVLPEDFNLDGLPDLFVASSGLVTNEEDMAKMAVAFSGAVNELVPQFDLVFWNQGGRSFEPTTLPHRGEQYPMVVLAQSAAGDFDGDGDLDVLVSAGEGLELRLLRNEQPKGNYLMLELIGSKSNPHGLGAVVELLKEGVTTQRRYVGSGGSLGSSHKGAHFGLGDATSVESVRIRWPSGTVQVLNDVQGNQTLRVAEP